MALSFFLFRFYTYASFLLSRFRLVRFVPFVPDASFCRL
nr:MAG TPA: hypothetical protein [Caudoviricetes sp.]